MHTLKIKISDSHTDNELLTKYYQEKVNNIGYDRDCGVDLVTPIDVIADVGKVTKINLGIECEFIPNGEELSGAFWLVPRSSIVNTPLQLANSIGIIDPEYRGNIIAAVRCMTSLDHYSTLSDEKCYKVEKGTRLFQIVSPDGKPIKVELVSELTPTRRGAQGFGSTNK